MISFEQLVERTKASNAVYRELLSNRVSSGEESDGVHFFEKEFTYTCHGPQAHAIASRFYSTSNVIKQDQGVDTIEVGSKMFATIMQALLLDRIRVNIWAKGEDYWRIVKTATPGDWSQVESLMAESDTFRPCFAALVICEDVGNDATIGFAALSTSDCSLTLYHPFGLSSIARLESLLVQHHIVECLVCTPGTTASTTSTTATTATATLVSESRSVVLAMLKRNNVVVHHATASVAKSDKIEQARCLAELSSLVDTSSSSLYTETAAAGHPDCLTFLHHMPSCAVVAAEAACRHLGLLTTTASSTQPQQAQRGYRILLGNRDEVLEYDSAVVQALHLFPTSSSVDATVVPGPSTGIGPSAPMPSLFELLNHCKTTTGTLTLRAWLLRPLRDIAVITGRQDAVEGLLACPVRMERLRETAQGLKGFPDISRLATKLTRSKDSVRLHDLLTLYRAVLRLEPLAALIAEGAIASQQHTCSLQSLAQSLRVSATKCAKFMSLVEEVVDDDRLRQTYGSPRVSSSPQTADDTARDFAATSEAEQQQWEEHAGGGVGKNLTSSSGGSGSAGGRDLFRDRWVRVKPSFTPRLQELYEELLSLQQRMQTEHQRVVDACSSNNSAIIPGAVRSAGAKATSSSTGKRSRTGASVGVKADERAPTWVVMLETSEVHGPHFRVTKKHATLVLKALQQQQQQQPGVAVPRSASSSTGNGGVGKGQPGLGALWGGKTAPTPSAAVSVKGKAAKGDSVETGAIVLSVQRAGTLFVTPQLKALSSSFSRARDAYNDCQAEIVLKAVEVAATYAGVFREIADKIGELDCYGALAHAALYQDWVRPSFHTETVTTETLSHSDSGAEGQPSGDNRASNSIESVDASVVSPPRLQLLGLRHPLLEKVLGSSQYIPSDLTLSAHQQMSLITGPNMGGKSTFMRAVGLCTILAQMGSFVPATRAHLQIHDKVYVRIGAADSVSLGVSTFMAEMMSVSAILQGATAQSLVLVDELGRGTSTDDGFGIAAAVLESLLVDCRATVLCATHFHDLTTFFDAPLPSPVSMSMSLSVQSAFSETQAPPIDGQYVQSIVPYKALGAKIMNMHASAHIDEEKQVITMLFAIQPGPALRSYGISVAEAVRFPGAIVREARVLESQLLQQR